MTLIGAAAAAAACGGDVANGADSDTGSTAQASGCSDCKPPPATTTVFASVYQTAQPTQQPDVLPAFSAVRSWKLPPSVSGVMVQGNPQVPAGSGKWAVTVNYAPHKPWPGVWSGDNFSFIWQAWDNWVAAPAKACTYTVDFYTRGSVTTPNLLVYEAGGSMLCDGTVIGGPGDPSAWNRASVQGLAAWENVGLAAARFAGFNTVDDLCAATGWTSYSATIDTYFKFVAHNASLNQDANLYFGPNFGAGPLPGLGIPMKVTLNCSLASS